MHFALQPQYMHIPIGLVHGVIIIPMPVTVVSIAGVAPIHIGVTIGIIAIGIVGITVIFITGIPKGIGTIIGIGIDGNFA